jgi:hypothetical protein
MSFPEFWLAMGRTGNEGYARAKWGKLSAADKAAIQERLSHPRSWAADMWAGKWLECRIWEETPPVAGSANRPEQVYIREGTPEWRAWATPPGGHHRPRHAREQPRRMVFSQQAATPGGRDPAESACPLKPRAPRVPPGSVGKRSTTFHMMVPKPARSNGTRPSRRISAALFEANRAATGDIS